MAKTGDTGGKSSKGKPSQYMSGMADGRSHMGKANSHGPMPGEMGEGPHKVGGWVSGLKRGQKMC